MNQILIYMYRCTLTPMATRKFEFKGPNGSKISYYYLPGVDFFPSSKAVSFLRPPIPRSRIEFIFLVLVNVPFGHLTLCRTLIPTKSIQTFKVIIGQRFRPFETKNKSCKPAFRPRRNWRAGPVSPLGNWDILGGKRDFPPGKYRGNGDSPGENPKTQGGNSFWMVCPKSSNKQLTIEFTAHNVLDSSYNFSIVLMSFFFSPSYSSTQ